MFGVRLYRAIRESRMMTRSIYEKSAQLPNKPKKKKKPKGSGIDRKEARG